MEGWGCGSEERGESGRGEGGGREGGGDGRERRELKDLFFTNFIFSRIF